MKKKIKKAIILAGGKGTRLYPVTLETPKPLLTVNKRPIINYLIDMFKKHGVTEVAITVRESDFEDYSWWLRRWQNDLGGVWVNIMVEKEPMGTIGYWANNLHTWTGDEPFFLTNGDELKDIDLSALAEHHEKHGAMATIAAVEVQNPKEYGVIVFDGDHVDTFLEKPENPPSNFISSGLYLIDPKIREYLLPAMAGGEKFLMIEKDLFPILAKDRKLVAFRSRGKWFDCGNLERWEKAIKEWEQK
ncbi:MAG: nucleotidyltransferase family protein [Candidatus Magasanikbacteria bacterium]|nr:nucleotidyltransferase family protein [Candidatus Magasanikbacteria bacterium]